MTTLTASRRSTSHRPHTSTVLFSALIVVVLAVATALIVPRLAATPTDTHPPAGLAYTGGGGGNGSHHQVRGHTTVDAASTQSAIAAEQVVAHQKQYLQQLVDQQTRLIDRATPRDTRALNALAAQVAAAKKALANALSAQKAVQTHRSR